MHPDARTGTLRPSTVPWALIALLALAGCASPPATPSPDAGGRDCLADAAAAIPFGDGHDHNDPASHHALCHAELAAWDSLQEFGSSPGTVVGAHVVARAGDLVAVGVNAGETSEGQQGFHLFDISHGLRHLSYFRSPQPVGGDRTLAFSADGHTLFLGYEGKSGRPGVAAMDVSDPTHPAEVAFWSDPQGYGSHTIAAGVIGDGQYVFALAVGVNILSYSDGRFTLVGKYATNDQLSVLDAPGSATGPQTYAFRSLYGHDMTFFNDPVTARPLLLVAYAYDGLKVLDLTRPSLPVLLGRWLPPADTGSKHYTHSVAAERQRDGRLLVVVGSETFEPENQQIASPLWILDASATVSGGLGAGPGPDPVQLSTWRNPAGAPAGSLGLSVHFFRLEEGLLYVSHYHGGVWGIDLRTDADQRSPQAFAYAVTVPPNATRPPPDCCLGFDLDGAPMVFDVEVRDGTVYAADETQGVLVLRFERPAPKP